MWGQKADGFLGKGVCGGASLHASQTFPFPSPLRHLEMTIPNSWRGGILCALAVAGSEGGGGCWLTSCVDILLIKDKSCNPFHELF